MTVKTLRTGLAPGLDPITVESLKLPERHEELSMLLMCLAHCASRMALERFDPHF